MELKLESPPEILRNDFFRIEKPEDIASLLEIDYLKMMKLLYGVRQKDKYYSFRISKRNNKGLRKIDAPITNLKIIQQKLNQVLQAVYEPKQVVHGFASSRSIVTNAAQHCGQSLVLSLDLKDFFPSINFGRVRGMFMSWPYNLPENVSTILARICCYRNELPQGAPTSPIVSNMICAKMDSYVTRLVNQNQCNYSRYADDITISTIKIDFPRSLVLINHDPQKDTIKISGRLAQIIVENGFEINESKVRLQRPNQRQVVTGLTVNEFPNLSRKFIRQVRAMLYAWGKYGLTAAEKEFYDKYQKKEPNPFKPRGSFKQIVRGKIAFMGMVRGKNDPTYIKYWNQLVKLAPQYGEPMPFPEPQFVDTGVEEQPISLWIETLPFPLAGILQGYVASIDVKEKNDHLLRFFEALAQFMAIILLGVLHKNPDLLTYTEGLNLRTLSAASFGNWANAYSFLAKIIRKMNPQDEELVRMFGTNDRQIVKMLTSKDIASIINKATSFRNSWSGHAGIISSVKAERQHKEWKNLLNHVYKVFGEKWSNYLLVEQISMNYSDGIFKTKVRNFAGASVRFRETSINTFRPLEDEKLYFVDPRQNSCIELLPLFKIKSAPGTISNWACYFYNKIENNDKVRFVSHHYEVESDISIEAPDTMAVIEGLQKLG